MGKKPSHPFRSFLIELAVYSLLVSLYVYFVLYFLVGWLKHLFENSKREYAVAALALIIGQAVVLEMVTTLLLKLIRSRTE